MLRDVELSIFRARRLGHVNFFVEDFRRSIEFYNSICGLTLEFVETDLKGSFLGTGHTPHDVGCIETTKGQDRYGRDGHLQIPKEVGAKPGLNHIAWEIENEAELVAGYDRCLAAGLPIRRLADHQIAHSIYMLDPDGNMIEFYVDTVREWRNVLHGEINLITSVWDPHGAPPDRESHLETDPELRTVAAAPIHPHRLTHVVLVSRDPDRLVEFYQEVAGLRLVGKGVLRGSDARYDRHLIILPESAGMRPGLHRFGMELNSAAEIEDAASALAARGVAVERGDKYAILLRDPDGQLVEFAAR